MEKNIVLLHGWGANKTKLEPLANVLRKKKWKVLVPELPGFGVPDPSEVWNLENYAHFVSEKAKVFFNSERYVVFGHSFGGGIGVKLSLLYTRNVSGLALCASRGFSRGNILKRFVFYTLAKSGKIFLLIAPLASFWRKILYKLAREHDYENANGIMKDIFKKIISEDLKPLVGKIKTPTLILWGKEDKMTPLKDALYLKKVLANSQLKVFDNVGHRLPYVKPEEIAREINSYFRK